MRRLWRLVLDVLRGTGRDLNYGPPTALTQQQIDEHDRDLFDEMYPRD